MVFSIVSRNLIRVTSVSAHRPESLANNRTRCLVKLVPDVPASLGVAHSS